MSISTWLALTGPAGGRHCYGLHDEAIAARAQQILDTWDTEQQGPLPDLDFADATARSEAARLARADQQFPDDWYEHEGYEAAYVDAPLHPDFTATTAGWHWEQAMPALPDGDAGVDGGA